MTTTFTASATEGDLPSIQGIATALGLNWTATKGWMSNRYKVTFTGSTAAIRSLARAIGQTI